MNKRLKLLIAYDGSESADAAVKDLQWAGLPHDTEVIVFAVADVWFYPDPDPNSFRALFFPGPPNSTAGGRDAGARRAVFKSIRRLRQGDWRRDFLRSFQVGKSVWRRPLTGRVGESSSLRRKSGAPIGSGKTFDHRAPAARQYIHKGHQRLPM